MLDPKRLGIAAGLVWAIGMAITTILSIYTGYGAAFLQVLSSVYPGFDISWPGVLIGFAYGFVDFFLLFFLIAYVYNKLSARVS